MLQRPGWGWTTCGSDIALDGLVATKSRGTDYQLATGGEQMTEGRHYWEVRVSDPHGVFFGAARPGLDHDEEHHATASAFFIYGLNSSLWANGKFIREKQAGLSQGGGAGASALRFATGDRIGVLLDLDQGWIRWFRNGAECGPGITSGVSGPLVRAAQILHEGNSVEALPGAVAPVVKRLERVLEAS
jgi:hypothetical protein